MEIQKELRLPEWVNSWNQLVDNLESDDELKARFNSGDNEHFRREVRIPNLRAVHVSPDYIIERFECDVNTLKMRAFDELHEIMPDRETLIGMIREARWARGYEHDNSQSDLVLFLDKLYKTLYS